MSIARLMEQTPQKRDAWDQGQATKQRKVWAPDALRKTIAEEDYRAAERAVRECSLCFEGAAGSLERVDRAWSDAGEAARTDARRTLENLRQAVFTRTGLPRAGVILESIVQMHTMADVAKVLGFWRERAGRNTATPDGRRAETGVRMVLAALAAYYEARDIDLAHHTMAAVSGVHISPTMDHLLKRRRDATR